MISANTKRRELLTIGGRPGSGKSTVSKMVAEHLGYAFFSTGAFARELAIERGLTLEAFNELVAEDGSLDELIDKEQQHIESSKEQYVIDAHLGFYFVPSSFKVYLDISLEASAKRILNDRKAELRKRSGDTMETYEEALERTKKRIQNHVDRYKEHYGVNPYDTSAYDLVIKTDMLTPETVTDIITSNYKKWLKGEDHQSRHD